ncbi:uncharacterized protein [Branchiostoma lanceolatum]|uniref:uncharacterized protein n=1 Tax=Branchiostoma lanceolatum TaxID=7740 RepID=UPI00345683B9
MARSLADKLQDLESRLEMGDGPEIEYGRALRDAIANMDLRIEVEALKCLGDLRLEKGRMAKNSEEFEKAITLYMTAAFRCTDSDLRLTTQHRVRYLETLLKRTLPAGKFDRNPQARNEGKAEVPHATTSSSSSVLNVARTCLNLVKSGHQSNVHAVEEEYTNTLVKAIENSDALLELEVMKGLGDLYLEEGQNSSSLSLLSKAKGMYKTATTRIEEQEAKEVLCHRVKYAEKVTGVVKRRNDTRMLKTRRDAKEPNKAVVKEARDMITQGDEALQNGDLEVAEWQFASALRLIHCPESTHLPLEAECLHRLGNVYLARGRLTKEGWDFTQATALYNAAIARTKHADLKKNCLHAMIEVEQSFLLNVIGVHAIQEQHPFRVDLRHKNELRQMREIVAKQVEDIDRLYDPYKYDEDDPKVIEVEAARVEAIRELFQKIAKDRKHFLDTIISECIAVMGQPPCKYAFIGLGSQATELVTPYSDLEFAILLEEDGENEESRKYFRNLTHYLHLKIINLGETILPAMGIKSLNDYYCEDDVDDDDKEHGSGCWFYDATTPRGFAFDGAMPWASKTPFGRQRTKTKPALELIQNPSKMASFQKMDIAVSEGYHLSDILQCVCCVSGDKDLFKEYCSKVSAVLESGDTNIGIEMADSEEFTRPKLTANLVNVKKEIYRFSSIAIQNIALRYGVKAGSIWNTIEHLKNKSYVSEENAHHLAVAVSISAELRLRAYIANGGQRENISALTRVDSDSQRKEIADITIEQVFYLPSQKMLYRYYYTALPLRKVLSKVHEEQLDLLRTSVLFQNLPETKGEMNTELCNFTSAMEHFELALARKETMYSSGHRGIGWCLYHLGRTSNRMGNHRQAKMFFERALNMFRQIHGHQAEHLDILNSLAGLGISLAYLGDTRNAITLNEEVLEMANHMQLEGTDHKTAVLLVLNNLSRAWALSGNYRQAINVSDKALRIIRREHGADAQDALTAWLLHNLGTSWSNLGDMKKAIPLLEEALKMRKLVYGRGTAHPDMMSSLHTLGRIWSSLGKHRKAIRFYEQALRMGNIIYGQDNAHPSIAEIDAHLGSSWHELGEFWKAIQFYENALGIQLRAFGGETAHRDIVWSFIRLGETWRALSMYEKSIHFHEQAHDMVKRLHGEETANPDVAASLQSMGIIWNELGDYWRAINFHKQALYMWKRIFGPVTAHSNIAGSLHNLAIALKDLGDYKKAIKFHEHALNMLKQMHGKNEPHPDIASSYRSLGKDWAKLGNHRKAITYHEQALSMFKRVYGDDVPHPDIALSFSNLGKVWFDLGDSLKAVIFLEKAFEMQVCIYGTTTPHIDIVTSLYNLGGIWRRLDIHTNAIDCYERALAMSKDILGHGTAHRTIAVLLKQLGATWNEKGDAGKSVHFLEEAYEMERRIYGRHATHVDIASTLCNTGLAWRKLGDNWKAMVFLQKGLTMMTDIYGHNAVHPDIARTLTILSEVWFDLGDYDKARSLALQVNEMKF